MGFEKEDIFLLETSSIKSLLKGIVYIRSHFKGRRVSAIVLEPFTRFSTVLSVWIGASKRIGCYRFLNEGVYLGNILTHRLVYNPHLHISQTYFALAKALIEPDSAKPLLKERIPSQIKNRLKINIPEKEQPTLMKRLQSECPENPLKEIYYV